MLYCDENGFDLEGPRDLALRILVCDHAMLEYS